MACVSLPGQNTGFLRSALRFRSSRFATASCLKDDHKQVFVCPTEESTAQVAALFGKRLREGDCYCLYGDVGAGKSVFSRGFIRAACDDEYLPVPSPTYLLQNIYDDIEGIPLHHFDLYRLSKSQDMGRLSLPTSFSTAVSLIEWAGRLGRRAPDARMDVGFSVLPKDLRKSWLQNGILPGRFSKYKETQADQYCDDDWRLLRFVPHGKRHHQILDTILQHISESQPPPQTDFTWLSPETLPLAEEVLDECFTLKDL
ncbi:hypothetical protein BSKO_08793 [Bryopsis sp. KO-2023]|nr:hypothetical protein BSKO_08793 [Bryopsis sp. KO-2023]